MKQKDFKEYRRPSKTEKEKIRDYYINKNKKKTKFYNGVALVTLFLAILLLYDTVLYRRTSTVYMMVIKVVVAVICGVIAYFSRQKASVLEDIQSKVNKGDFYIALCKGYETKKEENVSYMRVHKGADFKEDWFEIDDQSVAAWNKDHDKIFKLMRYEGKDELCYELFSDEKLGA